MSNEQITEMVKMIEVAEGIIEQSILAGDYMESLVWQGQVNKYRAALPPVQGCDLWECEKW